MIRKRPTLPHFAIGIVLIAAAVVIGSGVGAAIGNRARATVNGFPRVSAPGAGTVCLDRPGTYFAFYESEPPDYPMSRPGFPVRVMVVDAHGDPVRVSPAGDSKRTEFNGEHGGVAVARFTIARSGAYLVTVDTGAQAHRADVAIGQDLVVAPGIDGLLAATAPPVDNPDRALLLLAGLCLGAVGLGIARRRGILVGSGRFWRRQLAGWSLTAPDVDEQAIAGDVLRCSARLSGTILIGLGIGVGLATMLLAAVLQMTSRTWFDAPALLTVLYLGVVAGGPIAYGVGAAEIRRSTAGSATYADLRPRRAGDYLSPLVRWLGALPASALGLLTIVAVALRPQLLGQLGQLGLLLAGMVLTMVVAELLLAHVVAVPRLVVTADADASRRADDMLRSHVVGSVEGTALLGIGGLGVQATATLGVVAGGGLPDGLLIALVVGCMAVLSLGPIVWGCSGRLGSGITGWPWGQAVRR